MSRELGLILYKELNRRLKRSVPITLSFRGVRDFASPFFNYSLIQLYLEFGEVEFARRVHVLHLNELGSEVLEDSLSVARERLNNPDRR
jgi:hypothetical protein